MVVDFLRSRQKPKQSPFVIVGCGAATWGGANSSPSRRTPATLCPITLSPPPSRGACSLPGWGVPEAISISVPPHSSRGLKLHPHLLSSAIEAMHYWLFFRMFTVTLLVLWPLASTCDMLLPDLIPLRIYNPSIEFARNKLDDISWSLPEVRVRPRNLHLTLSNVSSLWGTLFLGLKDDLPDCLCCKSCKWTWVLRRHLWLASASL